MNQELIDKVKEVIRSTDENYSPYYDVLPRLINERGYMLGLELGVFCSGHCVSILSKTNVAGIVGIDPYKEYPTDQINMGTIVTQEEYDCLHDLVLERLPKNRFKLIRKTTDEAILDPEVQRSAGYFDFIFIDACHTAENLTKDIANYVPLVRQGGVVCLHDYSHGTFPELTPIIDNFAKEHNVELHIEPLHFVWVEKTW
jgi:hypothetical protein